MTVFVGRDVPLARLAVAQSNAARGQGSLVLVSGEAGIGKSRLVEAAATIAQHAGMVVTRGCCVDDPGCPPLWPWLRLARPWPILHQLLSQQADPLTQTLLAERFQLFVSIADALVQLAEPAGLVVVLEDLQWADRTSLLLLRHLTNELATSRLLVLATSREQPFGPLHDLLPELLRGDQVEQLPLGGLSTDDVQDWFGQVAELAPKRELAAVLHEQTRGNALMIRMLSDALTASYDDVGSDADAVQRLVRTRPDLRALVAARVHRLSPDSRRIIEAASVLGERLHADLLSRVTTRASSEVAALLDEAVAGGVLTPRTGSGADLDFAHALVRDAVYEGLPFSTRADLHRRAAIALAESPGPGSSSLVAAHWQRSSDPHAIAKAGRWWAAAAREAQHVHAYDEAADAADRALECVRAAGVGRVGLASALLQAAEARFATGRIDQSLTDCLSELADLGERAGDAELVAAAGLVIQGIGTAEINRISRQICNRALTLLEHEATPAAAQQVLRARLLAQVAVSAAEDEGGPLAAELSLTALQAADSAGDPEAILEALAARHIAICVPSQVVERVALGRRAVALAAASHRPMAEIWGHLWLADAALQLGSLSELDLELEAIDRVARLRGSALARWHSLRLRATYAALLGDFVAAREHNTAARDLATAMGHHQAASLFFAFLAQLAVVRGDGSESALSEHTIRDAPDMPLVQISMALSFAQNGEEDRARAAIETYRHLPATFPVGTRWAPTLGTLGMAAVLLQDAELAGACYVKLRSLAHYYEADGSGAVFCHGALARPIGDLALAAGRPDDAVGHYSDAIAMNQRIGARPFVALSRLGLATALAQQQRPNLTPRILTLLGQTTTELRRLDMPGPLQAALRLTAALAAAPRPRVALTDREAEVAQLVADALSNREIAGPLFLSERTVETHVRNILAKLGFTTRTEIATWLIRAGQP